MPRERSPDREKAFEIYKEHNGNIDLVEISKILGISERQSKNWKPKDDWDNNKVEQSKTNRIDTNKKDIIRIEPKTSKVLRLKTRN